MSINNETKLDRDVDAMKQQVNAMAAELAELNDELQGIVARDWTTHNDLARVRNELASTIKVAAELVAIDRRLNVGDLINVALGK